MVGFCVVGAVAWSHLPEDARKRFSTVMDLGHDYNLDPTDITGRGQIWSRALRATIARPIGYGPNTFRMVDLKGGGRFNSPHNIFLQIVVELGAIGLFFFVRMYVLSLRGLQRARNGLVACNSLSREQTEEVVFSRVLQIALIGNAVAGFFLSMAYATVLWTLFGLCMAIMFRAERSTGPEALHSQKLHKLSPE